MGNEEAKFFQKEVLDLKDKLLDAAPNETDCASLLVASVLLAAEAHIATTGEPDMMSFLSLCTTCYQLTLEADKESEKLDEVQA